MSDPFFWVAAILAGTSGFGVGMWSIERTESKLLRFAIQRREELLKLVSERAHDAEYRLREIERQRHRAASIGGKACAAKYRALRAATTAQLQREIAG